MAEAKMTVALRHHRTEITKGDNGGLEVTHHFKMDNDGSEYPHNTKRVTNNYGAGEHAAAMKDIAKTCCGGDPADMSQPGSVRTGKMERQKMSETRATVGRHLATLGGKNSAPAPQRTVA